ncbi:Transient receptor potential cation channel subfamily V member 5 [Atta colombica]|uniref:Transient receptor potential cation channel subfamily V member 5 n=1 Tax=Atta colombica TaxID=520822 RepID=A0A195BTK9_9HYME|nr:Transient receptor potential cation channel subfamily V member 5 [Atta colombica]
MVYHPPDLLVARHLLPSFLARMTKAWNDDGRRRRQGKPTETLKWEILPHPPDVAPSDYHLFRSMAHLPPLKAMENPADYDIDKDMGDEEVDEAKIDKSKYRLVCWNLSDRGAVGETILHLCMLHATAIHADLAKRLLRFYPKLINDIYLSDEYYASQFYIYFEFISDLGENVLHIAIVNEDPSMVKFLLDSGADDPRIIHERCFGNFMCPEDQKASRFDNMDHEWVCVSSETNYNGYVYWGEYPLSFAACLGQEECYRLILARGADPDKQDTNGNTVMHMLVIYEKLASDKDEHLELMDGVLVDLLNAKWNTFVKSRFYNQFFLFCFYFVLSLISFTLRPGPSIIETDENANDTSTRTNSSNITEPIILKTFQSSDLWDDFSEECRLMQLSEMSAKIRLTAEIFMFIAAVLYILAALREARFLGLHMFIENLMTVPSRVMFLISCCILMWFPFLRFTCSDEVEDMLAVVVMLTTAPYFLFFCRGFKTVGPFVVMIYRMIMGDLIRFVSIYLVFVMGFSQAYYIIFLSFDNPNTPEGIDDSITNPMPSPMESVMAMFLMSMTNFGDYFGAFDRTEHEFEAKLLFVLYMAIVAILLVNMLIAMMGNTYQKIAETRNEWQRQWARIVLVVERGVSPAERLKKLTDYSQPMSDGRKALVLRLNQTEEDKEEMKEILEMKRTHDRLLKKRQNRISKEKIISETEPVIIKN